MAIRAVRVKYSLSWTRSLPQRRPAVTCCAVYLFCNALACVAWIHEVAQEILMNRHGSVASSEERASARNARDIDNLADWLAAHCRCVALTGAGVSTGSGIPDYRDGQGQWKRKPPVQFSDFVRSLGVRQRYWARSLIGWPHFSGARPSAAHSALAQLGAQGFIQQVITQNVDGLHQQAGSTQVIDLHGRLDRVVCLGCGNEVDRERFQQRLETLNPGWSGHIARVAPDGDADLEGADFSRFEVPVCERCEGVLKPAVVFFGESVPRERAEAALAAVESADALLVVGSSLMVWSGFRLVRAAAERGTPVAAVNCGHTRADSLLAFKCEAECGSLLSVVAQRLAA